MKGYTINGSVAIEDLTGEIEAGTVCMIYMDYHYYIVTITRITDEGNYEINGDIISHTHRLMKFSAVTEDSIYPIVFKDWSTIIKYELYLTADIKFTISNHRFVEGSAEHSCVKCNRLFTAAAKQYYCKKCCVDLASASLTNDYSLSKETTITISRVKELLLRAFKLGHAKDQTEQSFNTWVDRQLK